MASVHTYRRRGLIGGGAGALDALDGASLVNGDMAMVYDPDTDESCLYVLDAASGADEDSPNVISPNANAGTKRWMLTGGCGTSQTLTDMVGDGTCIVTADQDGKLTKSGTTISSLVGSSGSKIISGGATIWKTGYTYTVAKASYLIDGQSYSFAGGDVTLDASDATHGRIDVIVLTASGTVSKVTGTASDYPQKPYIDPQSYVEVTWVFLGAGSTSSATETIIYKEGGEWTITSSDAGVFTVGSTTDKHAGTKSIEGTSIPQGAWLIATSEDPIDMSEQGVFAFYIKLKAAWTNQYIKIGWFLDGYWISNPVYVTNGMYGLSGSDVANWQLISIPIVSFGITAGVTANKVALFFEGALGGGTGCYFDDVVLQSGINGTSSAHQSLRPMGEWSATTAYLLNDTVTYGGNTYYCMFPCIGTDLPMAATNYWALLSEGGVNGPATNADNVVPRYDGANSNTLQTSLVTIDDSGAVNIPSGQTYNIDGSPHTHSGSGDGGVGLTFEATAKPTTSGIYHVILPYSMTVPANFSGSGFFNATNPSAQVVITIQKNGSNIGTCTVSTGGSATWSCSETAFSSGDIITFVFPAQDSTWAGVAITVKGVRA